MGRAKVAYFVPNDQLHSKILLIVACFILLALSAITAMVSPPKCIKCGDKGCSLLFRLTSACSAISQHSIAGMLPLLRASKRQSILAIRPFSACASPASCVQTASICATRPGQPSPESHGCQHQVAVGMLVQRLLCGPPCIASYSVRATPTPASLHGCIMDEPHCQLSAMDYRRAATCVPSSHVSATSTPATATASISAAICALHTITGDAQHTQHQH